MAAPLLSGCNRPLTSIAQLTCLCPSCTPLQLEDLEVREQQCPQGVTVSHTVAGSWGSMYITSCWLQHALSCRSASMHSAAGVLNSSSERVQGKQRQGQVQGSSHHA